MFRVCKGRSILLQLPVGGPEIWFFFSLFTFPQLHTFGACHTCLQLQLPQHAAERVVRLTTARAPATVVRRDPVLGTRCAGARYVSVRSALFPPLAVNNGCPATVESRVRAYVSTEMSRAGSRGCNSVATITIF